MYDVRKIRADFPILAREVNGKPLVYLDNGASAQKPQVVIDAVTQGYAEEYAKHNIKGFQCGIVVAESSGWFKEPIESLDDLKGLKMRFFGLGANVMQKMGVSTQLLQAGEIFQATDPRTQAFLLKTALAAQMTAATAEALTGEHDAEPILAGLHRNNERGLIMTLGTLLMT